MKVFQGGTFASICCLAYLSHSALADQVSLKNGDRVTGSIVKKDGKHLTIKSDQFGIITTTWDQVESIRTNQPVNVVLQDGRKVEGTLATNDGKVEVTTSSASVKVTPAEITIIRNEDEQKAFDRLQHPSWLELWTGTATVGFAGAAGNARTLTFTTAINADRATNSDKTTVYFNTIKASAFANGKNSDTVEAVRGGIGYDHNLRSRLFANVFNDWEYDKFQNLDLRFVFGGGLGFHALKSSRSQLDLLGGGDYNHSSFSTPLTRNSAELFFGDDYAFKLKSTTSLVQSSRIFADMSNTGMYRVNFDVGSSTKLSKWLNWNISLSDRYLNHPAPGRKTNDFLYTSGLGLTFAR